jgi:hypothetical protein
MQTPPPGPLSGRLQHHRYLRMIYAGRLATDILPVLWSRMICRIAPIFLAVKIHCHWRSMSI